MESRDHLSSLPSWANALLRCIVHRDYREEIEGDIVEKYQNDYFKYGAKKAQRRLLSEIISLTKLNLIFNLNIYSTMTSRSWLVLLVTSLLVIIGSISPFLPGPKNEITHALSRFAQTIGFIGIVFIPFGLIWLITEIRNKKNQKLNKWTSGYYPAWLTLIPFFLFIPLQIGRTIFVKGTFDFDLWPLIIITLLIGFFIYRIQKLKSKSEYKFNPTPLFIVLLPVVALLSSKLAVQKMAAYTREKAITKTQPLIIALEKYKIEQARYPDKLEDLTRKYIYSLPKFNSMGVRAYQYEKRGDSYQLSFEQNYHWYATEVVAYMKNGHAITKAGYENHPTKDPDWRYYLAD